MRSRILFSLSFGLALTLGISLSSQGQDKPAIVINKVMTYPVRDVDAAVTVAKISGLETPPDQERVEVPSGDQVLEILCQSRLMVGMGTVDVEKIVPISMDFEPGRTYRLGAKLDLQGNCTPTID